MIRFFFGTALTEVVIVGAGPAGLRVARKTAEAGFKTVVLEKKSAIGKPIQCAGLVSPRVLDLTKTDSVVSEPKKAVINSPSGKKLVLENDGKRAIVIDRAEFDREMAVKASRAGAEIKLKASAKSIIQGKKRKVEFTQDGETKTIKTDMVIGADGPGSVVRSSAGLPSPQEFLSAVQAVVPLKDDIVNIYLGNDIAPGFFLYEVPFKTGKIVGLASEKSDTHQRLIKHLRSRGLERSVITYLSGTIPIGNLERSVSDGLCLVGDSASQVKPLSGGGIFFGLKAADICSDVVIKALEAGDVNKSRLNEYHKRWQKAIGRRISREMKAREVFKNMSDRDIDELIETLSKEKVIDIIEEKGDIDNHSKLIKPLLKAAPELLKFTGPVIKSLF